MSNPEPGLLAVDLGLRMGLAYYERAGTLRWYRSHNLGQRRRLRRAASGIIAETRPSWVIAEGDRGLFEIWARVVERAGGETRLIGAEVWRDALLLPRQKRTGGIAKQTALELARRVIAADGAKRPTSLRHDAAEAILIGLWGVLDLGWRSTSPL